jgi:hypothetical protein
METEGVPADIDLAGIAAVFDDHADRVHTYCWSRRRDDEGTAAALLTTLTALARDTDHPGAHTPAEALGAARRALQDAGDAALDASRGRWGRLGRVDRAPVAERQAGRVLWDLLPDMPRRDHDIVELHFRAGLDGTDLADAMAVDPGLLEPMIARVGARVALLVGACTHGPADDCPGRRAVHARHANIDARATRRDLIRHAERCAACRDAAIAGTDPGAAARAMPVVPAPASTRAALLDALTGHRPPRAHGDTVDLTGEPAVDIDLTDDTPAPESADDDASAAQDEPESDGTPAPVDRGVRLRVRPEARGTAGLVLGFVLLAVAALLAWPSGRDDADAAPDLTVTADVAGAVATPARAVTETLPSTTLPATTLPPTTLPSTTLPSPAPTIGPLFFGSSAPLVVARDTAPTPYVFANVGDAPLTWSATTTGPFVVEPLDGVVEPGGTSTILLASTSPTSAGPLVDVGVLVLSTDTAADVRIELTAGG